MEHHQDFNNIVIDNNQIFINNNQPEYWETVLYISVVLFIPTLLIAYEIINKNYPYYSLIVLIGFLILFGRDLFKMVKSNVSLQINLKNNILTIENNNGIFKCFFKRQVVLFEEISNVEIVDNAVHSKYRATRWKEITMFNKVKQKFILASFDEKYPDSLIAQKVKFFFEIIIWTEKNKKQ